jgi:hypothetical protein
MLIHAVFGQKQLIQAQECGPLGDKAHIDALEKTCRLNRDMVIDAEMISSKPLNLKSALKR